MSGHLFDVLPAAGKGAPPFADARAAREWLKLLPLINTPLAHADLSEALASMNASTLPPLDRLKTLEQFRDTIHQVQEDWQKSILGKPLPLSQTEHAHWQAMLQLWQLCRDGYAGCWRAAAVGDASVAQYQALLAQRSLYYGLQMVMSYALVYLLVPQDCWNQLFAHYSLALQSGLTSERVRDSRSSANGISSCDSQFIQTLLFASSNPQQLSQRQQQWLHPVLETLAPRTRLASDAAAPGKFDPLRINLDTPAPPQRRTDASETEGQVLGIDTLQLAQSLIKRIKLLRQGETPQQLGLGSTLSAEAAEQLLRELYRHWCEHPGDRKLPRKQKQSSLQLASSGLSNQHQWLAQGRYAPPPVQNNPVYGNRDLLEIQMFGQTTTRFVAPAVSNPILEEWELLDESVLGLRLQRAIGGQRLQLQQLLTVQLESQRLCGSVRWLEIGDELVTIGIRLLPGLPSAAAARTIEAVRLGQEGYTSVILLPAMPALKEPLSLVQPLGWFRQGRVLELWDGQGMHKLRMQRILERGCDYERIHIVPAGSNT